MEAEEPTYTPGALDLALQVFFDMSAAWATFWVLAFVAAGIWLASRALPLWRCLHAIRTAPTASIGSGSAGVVKVRGKAYPGQDVPEGFVAPGHVWRATARLDTRSSPSLARSSSYSVAPILVRDEGAECIVDPLEAWVLPTETRGNVERHFGNDATYRTEKIILVGDAVFAIGLLGRARTRPGHGDLPRCTLRRSRGGVLLLSGRSESRTVLSLRLRFWPMALASAACMLAAALGLDMHLASYPDQSLGEYLRSLTGSAVPGSRNPSAPVP